MCAVSIWCQNIIFQIKKPFQYQCYSFLIIKSLAGSNILRRSTLISWVQFLENSKQDLSSEVQIIVCSCCAHGEATNRFFASAQSFYCASFISFLLYFLTQSYTFILILSQQILSPTESNFFHSYSQTKRQPRILSHNHACIQIGQKHSILIIHRQDFHIFQYKRLNQFIYCFAVINLK